VKSIYPKDEKGEYQVLASFIQTHWGAVPHCTRVEFRKYEDGSVVKKEGEKIYLCDMTFEQNAIYCMFNRATRTMDTMVPPIKNKRTRKK